MDIHIVQPGDTIHSIADRYGVTTKGLIRDNNLKDLQLVPGETIVIVYPSQIYVVQDGDTLESIALSNNITVNELLRNNPYIGEMEYLYPGEHLAISFNRSGNVTTHGYANTFIDRNILRKTLPYMTYLTVFNYRATKNGEIVGGDEDADIIQMAIDYGVIPLVLLTTLTVQGEVDLEITYEVLINEEIQDRLIDNILNIIKNKGYQGVNISAQFINSSNQELFNNYTRKIATRLKSEGYLTLITINPRIETNNNEVTFEQIDYTEIGEEVDEALILQYKWGFNYGPPSPVNSLYYLNVFLDYAITQIPTDKLNVGVPTIGYDWELPYVTGYSKASSLSLDSVLQLARNVGAVIEFDEVSQTPFFRYIDDLENSPHEVWFVNATTIDELVKMLLQKGISGTGIWNIMVYYTQLWLVINSQYYIIKLLPEF